MNRTALQKSLSGNVVYVLSIAFLGIPFLAVWIVAANIPVVSGLGDIFRILAWMVTLCFSGTLTISLTVNLMVFNRGRRGPWDRPLPASVAVGQALLLATIVAWLVTLQLGLSGALSIDPLLTWWELLGIVALSIFVFSRATYLAAGPGPEPVPEPQVSWWD